MHPSSRLISVHGERISDRRIRQGLRLSVTAGALGVAWITYILQFPMAMFMNHLGASGIMIGLIGTLFQITMCAQIPATLIAEHSHSRKHIWFISALIHRGLLIVPVLCLLTPLSLSAISWITLSSLGLSFICGHICGPLWLSWMAELIPDRTRSRFWASRQVWTTVATLIASASAGYILDAFTGEDLGFIIIFTIATVLGIAEIILHYNVPEPVNIPSTLHSKISTRLREAFALRDFRRLCYSMGSWSLAAGILGPFSIIYLDRVFHVSYSDQALLLIAASLGAIATSMIWGYVMDRIGNRLFGCFIMFLCALCACSWFFVSHGESSLTALVSGIPLLSSAVHAFPLLGNFSLQNILWLMLPMYFFGGACGSGVMLCQINLMTALSPKEGRSLAIAIFMTIVGIAGSLGPLIGGAILDWYEQHSSSLILITGVQCDYIHLQAALFMAIAFFISIPLLWSLHTTGDIAIKDALSKLLVANPLNVVNSTYNIYCLGRGASRKKRIHAIKGLGHRQTSIAVRDLIERLDDSSTDVREQAVYALGNIGSPDAIDALIWKLEDPLADLSPHIARALRSPKNPKAVDALMGKLHDNDRETQSESARTLGVIGDKRASASLLDILQSTNDTKVISASSEALASLGEIAAIYEILPRIKETNNPLLKRSLSVAVGDLFGSGYYEILNNEHQESCTSVEKMCKHIRKFLTKNKDLQLTEARNYLREQISVIESAYEDKDMQRAADALFDAAIGFSAYCYGIQFGGDAKALIDDLVWRDQKFGIGVWFLDLLRHNWKDAGLGTRERDDILLGLFFLYSWCK